MRITISGLAATGKGTIARSIAQTLGIVHFDAGLVFRYYAYKYDSLDILAEMNQTWNYVWNESEASIFENSSNITRLLQTPAVAEKTSQLASDPVHFFGMIDICNHILRDYSKVIVDGRSAGTLLLPDARKKFYLQASVRTRAERRLQDFLSKNIQLDLKQVEESLTRRDCLDQTREIDPLHVPDGAVIISTDRKTIQETCCDILSSL